VKAGSSLRGTRKRYPDIWPDHLQAGHHSPGVFIPRRGSTIPQLIAYLELAAYAADPNTYQDTITYVC
jgi:hypothetical protein